MIFKKYLPTSLFGRTFLIVMLPVLLLQIMVSIVFFDRHWSKMTERLAFAVTGEISAIISEVEDGNFKKIQKISGKHLNLNVNFFDNVKKLPVNNFESKYGIANDLSKKLKQTINNLFSISIFEDKKLVKVFVLVDMGVIEIDIPEGRLFSSSSYIFILWMVGLSVLLFTISMIFMRNQIRPIYRLGVIAERLGRGIPVGRIKPTGAREVRQAAEAFVNMQDRINQFIEQRTTMLAGVSHDLKTPLTRMKLQLEMMDDSEDKHAMGGDVDDMEQMIAGYLSFAKGDGGEEVKHVNLKDILDRVIDDAKRMSLTVIDDRKNKDNKMIWAKPKYLRRAFDNFISNSARYADTVSISVSEDYSNISINISDNGDGILDHKMDDVLKPFVRGEDSRNQKTGGVGLGLTIANDIIISHGGKLTLEKESKLGGLMVVIKLPI